MGRLIIPRDTQSGLGSATSSLGEVAADTTNGKMVFADNNGFKYLAKEEDVPDLVGINKQSGYSGRAEDQNYWFYVRRAGNYTHTGGVIEWDSVVASHGWNSSNNEFTAPVDGLYFFGGGLARDNSEDYTELDMRIERVDDNYVFASFQERADTNRVMSGNCSGVVALQAGNRVRAIMSQTHNILGVVSSGLPQSYFYGYLI